jgi:hypothetical protein
MSFDGNGNYVRIHNWTQDAANGLDINAGEMDAEDNSIQGAFNITVTRDGQGKMAADFNPSSGGLYNLGTGALPWLNITAKSGVIGPPSGSIVAWTINGVANANANFITSPNTAGQSFGQVVIAGTNNADYCVRYLTAASVDAFRLYGDGGVTVGSPPGGSRGGATLSVQSDIFINGVQIYSGVPINNQNVNYVLALTDQNQCISQANAAGSVTIPTNASVAFPIGTIISIYNNTTGNITIPTAGDTVRFGVTGASGTRTLAQNGLATILKLAATVWVITGSGLS